ncbi:pimeloyl-ACP methyl ester esterase BioH [Rosenbergiella nectarea]|uniref:pimeloyl-ACP methyl ester esterase BioH n=1 Tax=Rosenbergiella nectarea TaxID=988801 RepID=UPI001BD93AB4|nr:pimeloyl-ACP methyl ester esterase BioH [Rosenbergiella nectarea]MBT0730860.1 pimeloyl-ACP methyl ester esterase BioH [Rosenbergiella nectarea subsp. apis]
MTLFTQHYGQGDQSLVLLHGWGLNSHVWDFILTPLSSHFSITLIDLPGYGRSQPFDTLSLDEMASHIAPHIPSQSIVLGWSLGGLVAAQLAIDFEEQVKQLIFVASSPCFSERAQWPGITPQVLDNFKTQLATDFRRTIERFIALQSLGTANASLNTKTLKQAIINQPQASLAVLNQGLNILQHDDLREKLSKIAVPTLRIYGALDSLVPRKSIPLLDKLWPTSQSIVIEHAAHAPFISHPEEFCEAIINFTH